MAEKKPAAKKPAAKKAPAAKAAPKAAPKSAPKDTKVEEIEKKFEKKVEAMEKKYGVVDKLLKASWMKNLLASKTVNDINKAIEPSLKTIFTVVAVLAFLAALLGFIGVFGILGLGILGFPRLMVLLLFVAGLLSVIFYLMIGIGLIKKKKWLPFVVLLSTGWNLLIIILSAFGGATSGSNWAGLVIGLVFLLIILKNKSYFDK